MKTAIISDVHGNYPALLSVIKYATKNKVDRFIFSGDYIFDLPFSNQVTELIKGLTNAFVIKGNKEGYLKELLIDDQKNWNIGQIGALYQTFRELKADNICYLNHLPQTCLAPLPFHGSIYVTHFIKALITGFKKTECSSSMFRKKWRNEYFLIRNFLKW